MSFKLLVLMVFTTSLAQAHSGGVKKSGPLVGCHNDHKHGGFHCHSKSRYNGRSWNSEAEALNTVLQLNGTDKLESSKNLESKRYNRKLWRHWTDDDGDCQDTRAEVLVRDSSVTTQFKGRRPCKVSAGKWEDFYTGEVGNDASDFEIDHVVPLKHAHDTGGSVWSAKQKQEFANDPINLVVALQSTNRSKGANDFVNWHPANKARTCEYVKRWFTVKKKYNLKVTPIELENINRLKCSDVTVTFPEHEKTKTQED